ncbi:hypothetical protein GGI20_001100 [Coemansia sp. BCRC 34301]|nr:hypothetical protein GGI20_001100 [Coemansia sp. BCRC 34301]
MFTPLQEALKKLREVRETEQSQPKRQAVAAAPPNPRETANIDDVDFDFGDADVFDDLLVGDMDARSDAPIPVQPLSPEKPVATPQSVSRLAAFTYAKPAQKPVASQDQQSRSNNSQLPSAVQALVATSLLSQTSSETSHQDLFATPRSGSNNPRIPGQSSDFVTTVVSSTRRRVTSLAQQRQELPGPAGLAGEPIQCAITPTQRPTSAFKTPLSRRVHKEQPNDVDFEGSTWAAMLDHLGMPPYGPSTANSVIRSEEKAAWPISRVLELTRSQKIPTMLVQLREIGSSESDAGAVAVDPTGEIRVSIHHVVMRRVAIPLVAGTSIILHNVAAVKMPGWPPFLVVTGGTIEQIFTVKSPGTRDDPILIADTQRSTACTPARLSQRTGTNSVRPTKESTASRTKYLHAGAVQPLADLDDASDLLPDEPLFDDDADSTDML